MRIFCITALSLHLLVTGAFGQKKVIDEAACNQWKRLEEINGKSCLLSANGKYAIFKTYSEQTGPTVILKDIKSGIENKLTDANYVNSFDSDRMFSYQLRGDSLIIFDTENGKYKCVTGVRTHFIIKSKMADLVAYFTVKDGKKLTIWDIKTDRTTEFPGIEMGKYWINKQGTGLVASSSEGLIYTDLQTSKRKLLTADKNTLNATFSGDGREIAYIVQQEGGFDLRYYNLSSGTGWILVTDSSEYLKDNWKLNSDGLSFDNNDGNVFFKISRPDSYDQKRQEQVITRDVDVWSAHDMYLQPQQLNDLHKKSAYISMINVRNKKVVQIESEELAVDLNGNSSNYLVLTTRVNENEFYWNKEKRGLYLFSAVTGNKTLITSSQYPGVTWIGISPDNKFLVWFDGYDGNYYSYNTTTHKIKCISGGVTGSMHGLRNRKDGTIKSTANPLPVVGQYWLQQDKALIIHAENDIWKLDPTGNNKPINLTNGFGERHDIRLRILDEDTKPFELSSNQVLITGFDNGSKQNGFWKISLVQPADPVKLVMSDDVYHFVPEGTIVSENAAEDMSTFKPVANTKRNVFVVRRMNSSSPANLFLTRDFKTFKQISDIHAKDDYARIDTKVITYTLPDGQQAEGILHQPHDFDSTKKYPLIFNYYERRSEAKNVYLTPRLSGHNINIPWYISRGYLVFEPDFYYKRGETAQSIASIAESAVRSLSKIPCIDTSRLGAQGQSFGGYETNVLAIYTNLFKAACEMAGPTDIISEYGSIRPGGHNNQTSADKGQRNLGVFPWEHPEVFIKNSPVFHIGKGTTPLLIVHNKDDDAILFSQAIELFLGMRRIGKKVWMLQYDNEGHDINEYNNKLDFTIRMQQFFDHYLKGAPMPIWMSKGIPAKLKGIVSGLRYDSSDVDMKVN